MARIKKDNSSWKASGIERRDFRSVKNGPEVVNGGGNKKNRKKWCKGKVGVEHDPGEYVPYHVLSRFLIQKCNKCGKHLHWMRTPG